MTADKVIIKCEYCSKEFKYDSEKKRHEQSHNPQFQCKVCSKNFSFISALRRHEKQHERNGSVKCSECSREFRDQILLKRHTKYAHGGSYKCTKCDTIFNSEPALRSHMQTHKSEAERRYQCSFEGCTKKFNFPHHLKHHQLTHTNSKQHFCKICDKGFIQSHHLKAHLKTHSGDSSLYCTFLDCNKKFATEYAKKRHMTKHNNKTDSGISSDSNSTCDISIPNITEDDIFSPSIDINSKAKQQIFSPIIEENNAQYNTEDLSMTNLKKEPIEDTKNKIDNDINDCELALGRCIMHDEGKKCVCAQISKSNIEYDFTPIEDVPLNIDKLNVNTNNCRNSECCGVTCGNKTVDLTPDIEYKTDGTIKIKDVIDLDILTVGVENDDRKKFVPYNSCKAVLGNCIVSGDGTIDEGCLCARMLIDEQVTAQEIDDITPQPNVLNNQYYKSTGTYNKCFKIDI